LLAKNWWKIDETFGIMAASTLWWKRLLLPENIDFAILIFSNMATSRRA
jgi:hypothetical protein